MGMDKEGKVFQLENKSVQKQAVEEDVECVWDLIQCHLFGLCFSADCNRYNP